MNEPLEFRSVTDLEEIDTLPDDAKLMVLDNGTAKQISKENAKFGGGSVTKYLVTVASTQSAQGDVAAQTGGGPSYTITHEDGSEVTAQEAYDAFMSGVLIFETKATNGCSYELVVHQMEWQGGTSGSGDPTKVNLVVLYTADGEVAIGEEQGDK